MLETGHGASCLAMDNYWKAVEKLWTPNLKAPFSDCPNFTRCTLFYLGDLRHRQPCLVDVYDFIPTFGAIPSRIFQVYIIRYLSILLS